MKNDNQIICALATVYGTAAIALIRISGNNARSVLKNIFFPKKQINIYDIKSQAQIFGEIKKGNKLIDDVLCSFFFQPNSYTGEDSIEITCHGSIYIQQEILKLLTLNGARLAEPGEFTMRAFMNGKMDLAQAEAVADIIASENEASHRIALNQMKGGFSKEILTLREQLIHSASLIELELDFPEEDVEFIERKELLKLINNTYNKVVSLADSFSSGNAIKNGIPVAIIGNTNAGKSTLLNTLIQDNRAIVSDIHGTTRDSIEETLIINGLHFRIIDTAGIRNTENLIEKEGINRTYSQIEKALIVLYIYDSNTDNYTFIKDEISKLNLINKQLIIIANKCDLKINNKIINSDFHISISAKNNINIDKLKESIYLIGSKCINNKSSVLVSNVRHYESLNNCAKSLSLVKQGIKKNISGDLLSLDIQQAIYHMGEITGKISSDDLLKNIFKNFCIGK